MHVISDWLWLIDKPLFFSLYRTQNWTQTSEKKSERSNLPACLPPSFPPSKFLHPLNLLPGQIRGVRDDKPLGIVRVCYIELTHTLSRSPMRPSLPHSLYSIQLWCNWCTVCLNGPGQELAATSAPALPRTLEESAASILERDKQHTTLPHAVWLTGSLLKAQWGRLVMSLCFHGFSYLMWLCVLCKKLWKVVVAIC